MQRFKSWPIGVKIALAFGVIAVAVISTAIYQITAINRLERSFSELIDTDVQRVSAIREVDLASERLLTSVNQYLLQGLNPANKTEILTRSQMLKDTFETYASMQGSPGRIADLRTQMERVVQGAESVASVVQPGSLAEAAHAEFGQSQEVFWNSLDTMTITERDSVALANQHISGQVDWLFTSVVLVAVLSAVLAVVMGTLVTWWLGRSVDLLRKRAAQFAVGDFSTPVPVLSRDELGELASIINIMARTLRDTQEPTDASVPTPPKKNLK